MNSYAFLGGAFDPIHLGHIAMLKQLARRINFSKLSFLPYNISPTAKQPVAATSQRLTMAQLAVAVLNKQEDSDEHNIYLQDMDAKRAAPAYTYNSLADLRDIYGDKCHISFIMGDDCYATLNSWHKWDELCDLANLLVINRNNPQLHQQVLDHEQQRQVLDLSSKKDAFLQQPSGCIGKLTLPPVAISSSAIRRSLNRKEDVSGSVMPEVVEYIKQNNLYA